MIAYGDTKSPEGSWQEMSPSMYPGPRRSSAWAYDSIHNVIVLFGGVPNSSETWIYDLSTEKWTQKFPAISPPARSVHQMTFDTKNGDVVMFGGYRTGHGNELNDTWLYDVPTNSWRELHAPVSPPARHWPGLVYDERNKVVVLFGGHDRIPGEEEMLNDTWLLDVGRETWTQKHPAKSPSPRQVCPIFNENDGLIYIFGGKYEIAGVTQVYSNDMWSYDTATNTWTLVHDNSTSNETPEKRRAKWTFDPVSNEAILFGGSLSDTNTWIYGFESKEWTKVETQTFPSARQGNLILYDPVNARTLMYGGTLGSNKILDDVWEFRLNQAAQSFVVSSTIDQVTYVVSGKTTNVKVQSFNINPSRSLQFDLADGKGGVVELTFPKALINTIHSVTAPDGQSITFQQIAGNSTSTTIRFTVPPNTHSVEISGLVVPEFPVSIIAASVAVGIMLSLMRLNRFV